MKYNNISHCILIISLLSSKTDIDDCASHPCTNNGTCTDRVNGFNCSCTPGFNGTQCEIGDDSDAKIIFPYILGVLNLFLKYLKYRTSRLLVKGTNTFPLKFSCFCFALCKVAIDILYLLLTLPYRYKNRYR